MIGHENLVNLFKKLVDNNKLSHAYLFFGDPEIGKFLFAHSLANYLEKGPLAGRQGVFEKPTAILEELLIISPNEKGIISINEVRNLPHFLYQKPVFSKKRIVIINDSENMTSEAQNAVLKIVEDSPEMALIIFISKTEDLLLPSLLSRLQKIYFPKLSSEKIEQFLLFNFPAQAGRAKEISEISFGRIGRAIKLAENQSANWQIKYTDIDEAVENNQIDEFFEFLIIDFRRDLVKNSSKIKEVMKRLVFIKSLNTNKKLQMKAAIQ